MLPFPPTTLDPPTLVDDGLNHFIDNCALFNFSLTDLDFGSETAGLEYGVLGNMADKQEAFSFSPNFSSPVTPGSTHSNQCSPKVKRETRRKIRPIENIYSSVQKPFNYAEGFHYLIAYVTEKMSKEDLKRISRALSLFRPSFLSLIMNLTEEDLVFMEKCIQRTLLEYEKLISFSGTPTVVWRRTGEVCLVGKEFSLLTQWTKDMLL
ncbi:Transcriptional regulator of nonfermentable carbon utilization, partial [Rhizopus stolonifer]